VLGLADRLRADVSTPSSINTMPRRRRGGRSGASGRLRIEAADIVLMVCTETLTAGSAVTRRGARAGAGMSLSAPDRTAPSAAASTRNDPAVAYPHPMLHWRVMGRRRINHVKARGISFG
jgi:hypothetical protein